MCVSACVCACVRACVCVHVCVYEECVKVWTEDIHLIEACLKGFWQLQPLNSHLLNPQSCKSVAVKESN